MTDGMTHGITAIMVVILIMVITVITVAIHIMDIMVVIHIIMVMEVMDGTVLGTGTMVTDGVIHIMDTEEAAIMLIMVTRVLPITGVTRQEVLVLRQGQMPTITDDRITLHIVAV